jgi:hypothetical protein
MEKILITITLVFFSMRGLADTETNNLQNILTQAQASHDARQIISVLSDAEQLWPDQPEQYFQFMRSAAYILEEASRTNPQARQAALILFTNMLSKPFPSGNAVAANCIDSEYNAALTCAINIVREDGQKSDILVLANFMGEVRSRIVPSYTNKGTLNPPGVMDPSPEKVQEAIRKNKENIAMDHLQMTVRLADRLLTPYLLSSCSRFPSSNATNVDFIKQISDAAHLSDKERKKL